MDHLIHVMQLWVHDHHELDIRCGLGQFEQQQRAFEEVIGAADPESDLPITVRGLIRNLTSQADGVWNDDRRPAEAFSEQAGLSGRLGKDQIGVVDGVATDIVEISIDVRFM